MTVQESEEEIKYLRQERAGIICEDRQPTPDQEKIIKRQINQWLAEHANELDG